MGRPTSGEIQRLEARTQLALSRAGGGGGGGSSPVAGLIYREGGVAGGNVAATWAEVKAAIANASGVLDVYVDSSITSPSTVPASSGTTDCLGAVRLLPYRNNAADRDTLVVKDGATLHRPLGVFGALTLQVENVTTAGLTFNDDDTLYVQGGNPAEGVAVVEGLTGATLPVLAVPTGDALILALQNCEVEADQAGQVFVALAGTGSVFVAASGGVVYQGVFVSGGAGSTCEIVNFEPSAQFPTSGALAGFTGTLTEVLEYLPLGAAPGTPAYNPTWFAAGTIFIDPAAGSDSAAGTTSLTPIKTYAEAWRRWGSFSPALAISTSITFLSPHVDNTDPVIWAPVMSKGAFASIQGAAPATIAAVFTLNAAKSRAAGTNAMLSGSFSAGAPAAARLVRNTTAGKASTSWIYKTAGGANWNMTQPCALAAVPQAAVSAEVDTWASTDTVTLASAINVNVAYFCPIALDQNGAFDALGFLYQLTVFDPSGIDDDTCYIGNCWASECVFQRELSTGPVQAGPGTNSVNWQPVFNNCFFQGAIQWMGGGQPLFWAGSITAGMNGSASGSPLAGIALDGDIILGGATALTNGLLGLVFLDANLVLNGGSNLCKTLFGGSHVLYGTAGKTVSLQAAGHLFLATGTYAAGWTAPTLVTGITIDGATTANSVAYAGNVATIHNGITTSVANLDAAAGAAGFGGVAFNLGGSSISNVA